jgi:hypothetical protein
VQPRNHLDQVDHGGFAACGHQRLELCHMALRAQRDGVGEQRDSAAALRQRSTVQN